MNHLILNTPSDLDLFFEQSPDPFNWAAPRPYDLIEEDAHPVSRHLNARGEPLPLYAVFELPEFDVVDYEAPDFDFANYLLTH